LLLSVTEIYRLSLEELRMYEDRHLPEMFLFHELSGQNLLTREHWQLLFDRAGYRVHDGLVHFKRDGAPTAVETLLLAGVNA
jgi:hypothetical protein